MKRLIPASIIFLLIIVLCAVSNISVCKTVKKSEAEITRCEKLYNSGGPQNAYKSAIRFKKNWEKRASTVSAYSSHCSIDDISILSAVLPEAIKNKNDFEVNSTIKQIKVALNTVLKEQSFTLESLY